MINQEELKGWISSLRQRLADVNGAISAIEKVPKPFVLSKRRGRPPNFEKEIRAQFAWNNRPKRSGRKSMGSEERQQVSERMKKYWAGRRQNDKKLSPDEIRLRTGGVNPEKVN
jgi:hypothetical protein